MRRQRVIDEEMRYASDVRDTAVNHSALCQRVVAHILDITQSKWMRPTSKINHFMPYAFAAGASDVRRRCSRAVVALYCFIR